jgi:anti-anti-sigma factor
MPAQPRAPADEPNQALTIDAEELHSAHVVHIAGEIDMGTVGELEAAVGRAESAARAGGCRVVVIDLRAVTFLGADGLRSLVDAHNRIAEAGGSMRVVAPPGGGIIRRLMDLSGVGALLDIFETIEAALPPGNA